MAKGIKYIYSRPEFILFTNKYLDKIFKAETLSKKNQSCLIALTLLVSFLFFNKAYQELIRYTELTNRIHTIYSSSQNLSRHINSALLYPHLIKAGNSSKVEELYFTDSQSVIQQSDFPGRKERVLSLRGKFELIFSPGKETKIIISLLYNI